MTTLKLWLRRIIHRRRGVRARLRHGAMTRHPAGKRIGHT